MTMAQPLEQKGHLPGRQEGMPPDRQKAINEGRPEGKPEVALTMLQNGIDRSTVMKMTGLTEDDMEQTRH